MRTTVNLDPDVYDFASAYAGAKDNTLSAALSELVRQAEQAQEPAEPYPHLQRNEHGYYEIKDSGHPLTLEMVKEFAEDPIE
jgi:hypothetical protein